MKKLVLYVTGLLLMSTTLVAQQITGVVKDQQGKTLEKATVSLLHQKDSSIVKLVVTKDNVKSALIDSGYYEAGDFTGLE